MLEWFYRGRWGVYYMKGLRIHITFRCKAFFLSKYIGRYYMNKRRTKIKPPRAVSVPLPTLY